MLMIFSFWVMGICQSTTTPLGTVVYLIDNSPEMSQNDKDMCALWVQQHYPQATILQEASSLYNCHSFAWNTSEGEPTYWMDSPEDDKYWNDGSYIQEANAARGEKISYPYGDHSAIETTVDDIFISKWGAYPLCQHSRMHCPYDEPDCRVNYYSRYIRDIQNKTFPSNSDVKVSSHGTLVSGTNTIISSGAKVRFASDNAMNIESGFTVQNGATFTAETW